MSVLADRRPPMGSQEKDNFILSKKKTIGEKEQRAPPTDSCIQLFFSSLELVANEGGQPHDLHAAQVMAAGGNTPSRMPEMWDL